MGGSYCLRLKLELLSLFSTVLCRSFFLCYFDSMFDLLAKFGGDPRLWPFCLSTSLLLSAGCKFTFSKLALSVCNFAIHLFVFLIGGLQKLGAIRRVFKFNARWLCSCRPAAKCTLSKLALSVCNFAIHLFVFLIGYLQKLGAIRAVFTLIIWRPLLVGSWSTGEKNTHSKVA